MHRPIRTVDCVMQGVARGKSTYTDHNGKLVVVIHWPRHLGGDQKIYGAAAQLFCRTYNRRANEAMRQR